MTDARLISSAPLSGRAVTLAGIGDPFTGFRLQACTRLRSFRCESLTLTFKEERKPAGILFGPSIFIVGCFASGIRSAHKYPIRLRVL